MIGDNWRALSYRKAIATLKKQRTKIVFAEEAHRLYLPMNIVLPPTFNTNFQKITMYRRPSCTKDRGDRFVAFSKNLEDD